MMCRLYIDDMFRRGRRLYWSATDIAWTADREQGTIFHDRELPRDIHRWGIKVEELD